MKDVYEVLDFAHFAKVLSVPMFPKNPKDRILMDLMVSEGFLEYTDPPINHSYQITEKGENELDNLKRMQ